MKLSTKQFAAALLFAALVGPSECNGADPLLTSPAYKTGQFSFVLHGESKASYPILASINLTNWTPILTNYGDASVRMVSSACSTDEAFFEVQRMPLPLFRFALAARMQMDLGGNNLLTDSFDSTFGAYGGTNISAFGDVAAYLGITNSISVGNVDIYGRIFTGSNGSIVIGPQGSVGEMAWHSGGKSGIETGSVRDDLSLDCGPVQPPSTRGTFTPGNGDPIVLNSINGYYINGDLSLQNKTLLVTNANTFLYINGSLSMGGNSAAIVIAPGASLNLYVSGSVSIGGQGVSNPNNGSNFILYGLQTCTNIDFAGDGAFTGGIYAPNADLELKGGGSNNATHPDDFVGAIIANTIVLTGSFSFHYDENLLRRGPMR